MIKVFEPTVTAADLEYASRQCLKTGQFDSGPGVEKFEAALADRLLVPPQWVMVTSSCTAALATCYHFLVGKDRLQAPVLTWPGTYCAHRGKVLFYDAAPDPDDGAAVWVDLYGGTGLPVRRCHPLIVDAAHNCLSTELSLAYNQMDALCFSFGPTKQLTTIRGGCIVSRHIDWKWRAFIHYGAHERLPRMRRGGNYTMPDFNAWIGLRQLERFDAMEKKRRNLWQRYEKNLDVSLRPWPRSESGHILAARLPHPHRRGVVCQALKEAGVQTSHHYPLPSYLLAEDYPRSHYRSEQELTLPLHLKLKEKDVDMICEIAVREAFP